MSRNLIVKLWMPSNDNLSMQSLTESHWGNEAIYSFQSNSHKKKFGCNFKICSCPLKRKGEEREGEEEEKKETEREGERGREKHTDMHLYVLSNISVLAKLNDVT